MPTETQYQQAPQRDSFEEQNYTEAPPSYQDGNPQLDDGMLGTPREEDDHVPDDFKYGGLVSEAALPIRMQFVRKVYSILTAQIIATVAISSISYVSESYRLWIQSNVWMLWITLFSSIAFMLLTYWKRKSYPTNLVFLGCFTALEAYTISVIVTYTKSVVVLEALVLTLGIFLALTLFACQTKYDFTSWIPYLFGAIWGLILFGFVAIWFPYNSTAELVYGGLAALIFSGYILVDTQLIIRHYHVEEEIAAAISLYLDIINLFLAILRILNSQQNN